MRYVLLVCLSALLYATTAATPWGGSDTFHFDIEPRVEFPQSLADGAHPHAWAEDVLVPQSSKPINSIEVVITPWTEFEYAYDSINTSNIPGGEHWVGWDRITNRVRLRDSSDGLLLAEHRQWLAPFRERAPKGGGGNNVDFGNPPVQDARVFTGGDDVLVLTLDDPDTLSRFQGDGDVELRVVAWSDYEIDSPADAFYYGGVVRCGVRVSVTYH